MNRIDKRYDFVFYFDVKDGNPNGDPDAGNLPRIDVETGKGLVTDVCLKRKIRNYVQLTKVDKEKKQPLDRYSIYVKEKAVLGIAHEEAFKSLGIDLGQETSKEIPQEYLEPFQNYSLPDGITIEEGEDDKVVLVIAADADKKLIKEHLKENPLEGEIKKFLSEALKGIKSRKPKAEEVEKGRQWMCDKFYDIRTFGAVMSLKSAPNCGQVRGPVQLTFARTVDPVIALEHSITRMAVATRAESEKQSGDNRTMGRKFTIPYGLYYVYGFVSAHLAEQTDFSREDIELLWEALLNMFDHDHSAARGLMSARKLVVFEHDSPLGNKPAHELFARVIHKRKTDEKKPARDYSDYEILLDGLAFSETFKIVPVK